MLKHSSRRYSTDKGTSKVYIMQLKTLLKLRQSKESMIKGMHSPEVSKINVLCMHVIECADSFRLEQK